MHHIPSRSPIWEWQGPQGLEPSQLPPRMHIRRKLDLETEQGFKPRHTPMWDSDVPNDSLTTVPRGRPSPCVVLSYEWACSSNTNMALPWKHVLQSPNICRRQATWSKGELTKTVDTQMGSNGLLSGYCPASAGKCRVAEALHNFKYGVESGT